MPRVCRGVSAFARRFEFNITAQQFANGYPEIGTPTLVAKMRLADGKNYQTSRLTSIGQQLLKWRAYLIFRFASNVNREFLLDGLSKFT